MFKQCRLLKFFLTGRQKRVQRVQRVLRFSTESPITSKAMSDLGADYDLQQIQKEYSCSSIQAFVIARRYLGNLSKNPRHNAGYGGG